MDKKFKLFMFSKDLQLPVDMHDFTFKALINHELRTPLTYISAAVEMAEIAITEPALKDSLPEFLKIISNGAKQLSNTINEILLFGQLEGIEQQSVQPQIQNLSFNINELLSEIVNTLTPAIQSKGFKVIFKLQNDINLLNTDKGKVAEVLLQILSNAIKFTPVNGTITIKTSLDKSKKNIIIAIKDTGPGINIKYIERIFQPFFQTQDYLTREIGGLGLGLTIAKQLVYTLGGTLDIASKEDKGTCFTVTLPFTSPNIQWKKIVNDLTEDTKKIPYLQKSLWHYTQTIKEQCQKDITIEKVYVDMIKTLAIMIETRDQYAYGHSQRVTNYAVLIAKELDLPDEQLAELSMGSLIHDIGKIGISDAVLLKKEPLSIEELEHIRTHPEIGAKLLNSINLFESVIPMVLYHHEHYDGKGYPTGLSGKNIPLCARIICVADAFDALTSERPYRARFTLKNAVKEIEKFKGTQFDPDIVEVFIKIIHG